jgi:hypothetical protein
MEPIEQLESKFDTCKSRSEQEITRTIRRCSCQGGNYDIKGYFCEKRDIFNVTPEICRVCDLYEHK